MQIVQPAASSLSLQFQQTHGLEDRGHIPEEEDDDEVSIFLQAEGSEAYPQAHREDSVALAQ